MALFNHPNAQPAPGGYKNVSPAEVTLPVAETTIVDVREPAEYTGPLGHIPGARLVPLTTLEAAAASWDHSQELLVVCLAGGRSAKGATRLAQLGFTKVLNLTGGMQGWHAAGKPVEK